MQYKEKIKVEYFIGCNTEKELKERYKKLLKQYHPDLHGGNDENCVKIMQKINAEYDQQIEVVKRNDWQKKQKDNQDYSATFIFNSDDEVFYRKALEAIIHIPGLEIELIGTWIWVSGETKKNWEALKAAGYYYASKKQMCYFRTKENAVINKRKLSIEQIRSRYGSIKIESKLKKELS